jgi:hypothetical protein
MDHDRSHADNGQHDRYHCRSLATWKLTIPRFAWRQRQDWSRTDAALSLPDDHDLVSLALSLYPVKHIRPSHHVLTSLVAERHLCRWAKQPMHWNNRDTIRQPVLLADGTHAAVAGRWFPMSADMPPVVTIPATGLPGYDVVAAVAWHGFDFEPEFLGWHTIQEWKHHAIKGKTDLGLAGLSLPRRRLLPMTQLKPHTSERQQLLFMSSE